MRNIWEIFKRDALRIRNNVIAIIAIVGITVVPCLYAWFNIAASWDPYKNTGNLKVAVASVDEGYDGELIPIEINVGDQILSMICCLLRQTCWIRPGNCRSRTKKHWKKSKNL